MKRLVLVVGSVFCIAFVTLVVLRQMRGETRALQISESSVPISSNSTGVEESAGNVASIEPADGVEKSSAPGQNVVDTKQGEVSKSGEKKNQPETKFASLVSVSADDVPKDHIDMLVVGRPFPVSPAVQPYCAAGGAGSSCEDNRRLSEFAQEARDLDWAPIAETAFRSMIEVQNPEFAIRNIECRLITCVLEVDSSQGTLRPSRAMKPDDWRKYHVKPFSASVGFEQDATRGRITVSLWMYERIR